MLQRFAVFLRPSGRYAALPDVEAEMSGRRVAPAASREAGDRLAALWNHDRDEAERIRVDRVATLEADYLRAGRLPAPIPNVRPDPRRPSYELAGRLQLVGPSSPAPEPRGNRRDGVE